MIVEFSVKNYRSIKDLQTLSFRATDIVSDPEKYPDVDKNNIVEVGGTRLLKTVGIYGANASGKSNVLKAFLDFCRIVSSPPSPDDSILKDISQPFFEVSSTNPESFFQIVLLATGKKYRYGFTLERRGTVKPEASISNYNQETGEQSTIYKYKTIDYVITSEWLYEIRNTNQEKYFLRRDLGVDKKELPKNENIPPIPYSHTLFLKHAASFNGGICSHIWSALKSIRSLNDKRFTQTASLYMSSETGEKKRLLDFLSTFNLNYSNIHIDKEEGDRNFLVPKDKIYLEKNSIAVNLERHESEGTKKLFDFAGFLISVFGNTILNFVLTFDEIESNFHPSLVIKLIQMFNDPKINKSNAQLLFTSHDTNLLAPAIMRRDQFYFTEKDQQDATRLYALSDLKGIPDDADFARQYLAGFYGAVPMLHNFNTDPVTENV